MRVKAVEDVEECRQKIVALLIEYNCHLSIDSELDNKLVLVDNDNLKFKHIAHKTFNQQD